MNLDRVAVIIFIKFMKPVLNQLKYIKPGEKNEMIKNFLSL